MDANATTPLAPEVVEAMRPYWIEQFGNPSSIHAQGQQAHAAVDRARESLARLFHCNEAEVIFTGGGTEGDNSAIFGMMRPGDHLITTSIEHRAVLQPAEYSAARGVEVTYLCPQPNGAISAEAVRAAITPRTRLISVMLANNETGVLQPVEEIGRIAAEAGVYFHTDAVQGAGKVHLDVDRIGCHLLTVSGHKFHGPKGVGALYVRPGTPLEPFIVGGSHERRMRAGTVNVPAVVGLAKAADLAIASLTDGTEARLVRLRNRLEAGMLAIEGTAVNGAGAPRTANTTNIRFEGVDGAALMIALDLKGLAVSGGSACHSGAVEPSHVLIAMGLDKNAANASLRFSLLRTATKEDVDYALHVVPDAVERLRKLSPIETGTLA